MTPERGRARDALEGRRLFIFSVKWMNIKDLLNIGLYPWEQEFEKMPPKRHNSPKNIRKDATFPSEICYVVCPLPPVC